VAAASTRDIDGIYTELRDEHRQVMELVARLSGHRELAGLAPLLEELHEILIRHFSHEQFPGGLYESMGAYGPQHHDEIKVLVRDHCLILSTVSALLERVRSAGPADESRLLEEVGELIAQIEDHERIEHALAEKLTGRSE